MYQTHAETDNFHFWTKLAKIGCFQPRNDAENITIEFCIFELI